MTLLISTVLISGFLWGISLYNGWLREVGLFGYGMFHSIFMKNKSHISSDNNVTTVKYGEFAYKLLTNITIPNNITTIEDNAFKGNKLTKITLGSNVSLGRNSFGSGFEAVYKNNNMFAGTYTRTDHKGNDWSIWHDNFRYKKYNGKITITGCNGTTGTVIIPEEINGGPVTVIAEQAFKEKRLTSLNIPVSVISIERNAFRENQITSVNIPNSVTSIGNAAFYKNQLATIDIGEGVTSIGEHAFSDNKLTRVYLPNSVKNIGVNAFAENQIIRVSIGANVTLGDNKNSGILGENTGFNTAYSNNNRRAGIYTRPNTRTTAWTRVPR